MTKKRKTTLISSKLKENKQQAINGLGKAASDIISQLVKDCIQDSDLAAELFLELDTTSRTRQQPKDYRPGRLQDLIYKPMRILGQVAKDGASPFHYYSLLAHTLAEQANEGLDEPKVGKYRLNKFIDYIEQYNKPFLVAPKGDQRDQHRQVDQMVRLMCWACFGAGMTVASEMLMNSLGQEPNMPFRIGYSAGIAFGLLTIERTPSSVLASASAMLGILSVPYFFNRQ